jgi:hypothetical protein
MILRQSALTVIAPVKPDEVAALKDLLDELGKHDEQSTTRHPPSFAFRLLAGHQQRSALSARAVFRGEL